jgi:hypothetical protein
MSDKTIRFGQTEIKSIKYNNELTITPGVQVKLEVKNSVSVLLNMATPLTALVEFTFIAKDTENDKVSFELITCTPVTVSSFVDNLDKVIQERYMPRILLAVNEKIRAVATTVGMNIKVPDISFPID